VLRVELIKKANDRFETSRPTRMRTETSNSWDRDRDRDQKKWSRDHVGLETL